jgi:hypothetical protein
MKPGWIAGWAVIGFVLLLVTCSLRNCGNSGGGRQIASTPPRAAPSPEEVIAGAFQTVYSQNKQQIFDKIHPLGIAKSVVVHDVTITAWKHGRATNRPEDILQYTVRYTIYWEGPITKDGFTKISQTFDTETQRCVSAEILATNGTTNSDVAYGLGVIGGALLRAAMENSSGQ